MLRGCGKSARDPALVHQTRAMKDDPDDYLSTPNCECCLQPAVAVVSRWWCYQCGVDAGAPWVKRVEEISVRRDMATPDRRGFEVPTVVGRRQECPVNF